MRSGYLAIEPTDRDASMSRRLIPVTVIPDRAPTIRVEAPGKDLLLPDATPVVGFSASAADDFGLQSLELRYTKVSGSGRAVRVQRRLAAADDRTRERPHLEGADRSRLVAARPRPG